MMPLLSPEDNQTPPLRRILALGLGAFVGAMLILRFVLAADQSAFEQTMFPMIISVIVIALVFKLVLTASSRQNQQTEKRKREGTDMYTLIDRLVDDLDDDEATYLRQRLDERERGLERHTLTELMEDQLDQRAQRF